MPLILVVDDDPEILEINCEVFTKQGYSIVTAKDGEEALDVYARTKPDLICTDLIMPNLGGMEMAEILREHDATVPIILVTGARDEVISGDNDVFNAIFYKPYVHEELADAARLIFEGLG